MSVTLSPHRNSGLATAWVHLLLPSLIRWEQSVLTGGLRTDMDAFEDLNLLGDREDIGDSGAL